MGSLIFLVGLVLLVWGLVLKFRKSDNKKNAMVLITIGVVLLGYVVVVAGPMN